ncbi:hypothetical protein QJS10_CPB14g00040 [Acorus calamus]|uniref:DUF4408 domain-containing protein n=1 Tax=Acorus calamus TaxID=4465 RepID=A0AAV9DCA7_ACOCL|nr:hypothetical protein QJS10_CPB14g00040 [Acorus calamus]
MDHFFDFDMVKAEKAIAMRRYRRLQKLRNLFRAAELLSAVILLSWFSARIPFVLRISGDYLRRLSAVLVSPRFVFLLGNAIVLTLFAKSGHLNSSSDAAGTGDLYSEFINRQKPSPPPPAAAPEEIVYHDKGVCEESVSPVPDQRRPYGRSLSERAADNVKESRKDLRRSETDIGRKTAAVEREEKDAVVEMSNEEFRRKIEAFIAKQIKFQMDESLAVVSAEPDGPDLKD